MDEWCHRHLDAPYDAEGRWAASGKVDADLLDALLADPYFALPAPKSTGRDLFHMEWLDARLAGCAQLAAADVQATLTALTARTIADALKSEGVAVDAVYVCGGGAYNTVLIQRLETLLHPMIVTSTQQLGIAPEWVEAMAFAWLAHRRLEGKSGNIPSVTGAAREVLLGAVYPP